MNLGETPTGRIVNATRIATAGAGVVAAVAAIASVAYHLFSANDISQEPERLYASAALFAAGLLLIRVAKNFSIQSLPFLIPDVLHAAQKADKPMAEMESMVRTLEAHAGAAAFFNRVGFSGLSLGTIASAFLLILLAMVGKKFDAVTDTQYAVFLDLAKLLFGAFVGSFATRPNQSRDGPTK